MGDPDGTTTHGEPAAISLDKGKGKGRAVDKAQPEDVSMGENEESSSDESVLDDHVVEDDEGDEESGHDDLDAISTSNIIASGQRTRGKMIDFAEAAAKAQADGYDEMDDDDDDDDFEAHEDDGDGDGDAMLE